MGIFSIRRDWGVTPSIVRVATTDNLATLSTPGYLSTQTTQIADINEGAFEWSPTDYVLIFYSDNGGSWGFFQYDSSSNSFVPSSSGVPIPDTDGQLIIGSTGNPPGLNTLTAGSGVSIVNGPSSITISASGGGGASATDVQQSAFNHGVDTGTSTAYQVALNPAISSYTDGLLVSFIPLNTNSSYSCTLNVNGLGDKSIIINAATGLLSLGDIDSNYICQLIYSATTGEFLLLNPNVSKPVLRDMLTGNGYWSAFDSGVAADAYEMILTANVASGASQSNPIFAILIFANATNTGPSTLSFSNGVSPYAIVDSQGAPLSGGEIVQSGSYFMFFDSSSYRLLNSSL